MPVLYTSKEFSTSGYADDGLSSSNGNSAYLYKALNEAVNSVPFLGISLNEI